jgi:general stress protein CsbA
VGHLTVTIVHAGSHFALQILPSGLDLGFILAVIMVGPVVGVLILRFNRALAGGLLAVLLGASFVYGFYSHFVLAGPDNVSLVASEPWTVVFVVTAVLLGALEIIGIILAAAVFRAAARTLSEPAGPPA